MSKLQNGERSLIALSTGHTLKVCRRESQYHLHFYEAPIEEIEKYESLLTVKTPNTYHFTLDEQAAHALARSLGIR